LDFFGNLLPFFDEKLSLFFGFPVLLAGDPGSAPLFLQGFTAVFGKGTVQGSIPLFLLIYYRWVYSNRLFSWENWTGSAVVGDSLSPALFSGEGDCTCPILHYPYACLPVCPAGRIRRSIFLLLAKGYVGVSMEFMDLKSVNSPMRSHQMVLPGRNGFTTVRGT
jgi:hypothetical protein